MEEANLSLSNYQILHKLPGSSPNNVFLVECPKSNAQYVYKQVSISNYPIQIREIEVQARLKHKFIIDLIAYRIGDSSLDMLIEYASNGDLFSFINSLHSIGEFSLLRLFFKIVLAVDYIHTRGFVHRDIKPENILICANMEPKLADFGSSAHRASNRKTFCGTVEYIAPEVFMRCPQTDKVDVWALGVLLFEMTHNHPPFKEKNLFEIKEIIDKEQLPFNPQISPRICSIIVKILQIDPKQRPSARQILNFPEFDAIRDQLEESSENIYFWDRKSTHLPKQSTAHSHRSISQKRSCREKSTKSDSNKNRDSNKKKISRHELGFADADADAMLWTGFEMAAQDESPLFERVYEDDAGKKDEDISFEIVVHNDREESKESINKEASNTESNWAYGIDKKNKWEKATQEIEQGSKCNSLKTAVSTAKKFLSGSKKQDFNPRNLKTKLKKKRKQLKTQKNLSICKSRTNIKKKMNIKRRLNIVSKRKIWRRSPMPTAYTNKKCSHMKPKYNCIFQNIRQKYLGRNRKGKVFSKSTMKKQNKSRNYVAKPADKKILKTMNIFKKSSLKEEKLGLAPSLKILKLRDLSRKNKKRTETRLGTLTLNSKLQSNKFGSYSPKKYQSRFSNLSKKIILLSNKRNKKIKLESKTFTNMSKPRSNIFKMRKSKVSSFAKMKKRNFSSISQRKINPNNLRNNIKLEKTRKPKIQYSTSIFLNLNLDDKDMNEQNKKAQLSTDNSKTNISNNIKNAKRNDIARNRNKNKIFGYKSHRQFDSSRLNCSGLRLKKRNIQIQVSELFKSRWKFKTKQ